MPNVRDIKKEVKESLVYSQLLFRVNVNDISPSDKDFQKKIGKTREVLVPQLSLLLKKGYLKKEKPINVKGNKQFYYINWEKIISDFLEHLDSLIDTRYQECLVIVKGTKNKEFNRNLKNHYKTLFIMKENKELLRGLKKDLIKNDSLIYIFKNGFKNWSVMLDFYGEGSALNLSHFFREFIISFSEFNNFKSVIEKKDEHDLTILSLLCDEVLINPVAYYSFFCETCPIYKKD